MQLANKMSDNINCPCRKILDWFSLAHCGQSDTILDVNGEWAHCGESDTILDANGEWVHCGESDTILDANGEWAHCGESDTILDVNGDSAKIMLIVTLTLFRPPIRSNLFTFQTNMPITLGLKLWIHIYCLSPLIYCINGLF